MLLRLKTNHLDKRHVHVLNLNFPLWIRSSAKHVLGRHPPCPKRGKYFHSTQVCGILRMLIWVQAILGRVKTLRIEHTTLIALFKQMEHADHLDPTG